jgi:hypothetical protein
MERREFLATFAISTAAAALQRSGYSAVAASITLKVELPKDRKRVGRLWVLNESGKVEGGPWPVLGKADGETAKRKKNPNRAPLAQYGDTPTGAYSIVGGIRVGDGTSFSKKSYGVYGALRLAPTGGDAKLAKEIGGRTGLLIHGGDLGANNRLRPTNGCMRLSNTDMKALLDTLVATAVINGVITARCNAAEVAVEVTDPTAAPDEGYEEGDPPPTASAPALP